MLERLGAFRKVFSAPESLGDFRQRQAANSSARCSSGLKPSHKFMAVPSSAAKQAPESNRGQDNQSIELLHPTSAAVRQSPISA
jgi:hypothetical protein